MHVWKVVFWGIHTVKRRRRISNAYKDILKEDRARKLVYPRY